MVAPASSFGSASAPSWQVRRVDCALAADPAFAGPVEAGRAEGMQHLDRLAAELQEGGSLYAPPAGALFGCWAAGALLGIGGLTPDPWATGAGRIRRFFVMPAARRRGIGSALLGAVISAATGLYPTLRLRAPSQVAARFYEAHGFAPIDCRQATHQVAVPMPKPAP